jgi:hypothetical protein
VNAGDRAHWLNPSPPIAVDGEEPAARKPRPTVLPPDPLPEGEAVAPEDERAATEAPKGG